MRLAGKGRQAWRLLKFIGIVIALELLLSLPGLSWPKYLDSPIGLVLIAPLLSAYAFHAIGVPGLLEHNGACGWGWCAPTVLGWALVAFTWLASVVLLAWLAMQVFARRTPP